MSLERLLWSHNKNVPKSNPMTRPPMVPPTIVPVLDAPEVEFDIDVGVDEDDPDSDVELKDAEDIELLDAVAR